MKIKCPYCDKFLKVKDEDIAEKINLQGNAPIDHSHSIAVRRSSSPLLWAVSVVSVLTAAVSLFAAFGGFSSKTTPNQPNQQISDKGIKTTNKVDQTDQSKLEQALQLAKQREYDHQILLADHAWRDNKVARFRELLAKSDAKQRNFEWRYLKHKGENALLTLPGNRTIAFDPKGENLAAVWEDHTVKIHNFATGKETLALPKQELHILAIAFAPDGKTLVTAAGNLIDQNKPGELKLWDATTGKELHSFSGHTQAIAGVAISPDGNYLASASADKTVKLWDLKKRELVHDLKQHNREVTSVCFRPDGKYLASAGNDQTILVWNRETGIPEITLRGHMSFITRVAFSPDGKLLASASGDGSVKIWDVGQQAVLYDLQGHSGPVTALAFRPDSLQLATGGSDRLINTWSLTTGRKVHSYRGHAGGINDVEYHSDGRLLASADQNGQLRVWDTASGQDSNIVRGHRGWVVCLDTFENQLIASGSADGTARLWDMNGGEKLALPNHKGVVTGVAFSPDGKHLATCATDQLIYITNLATKKHVNTLQGHTGPIQGIAYHPNGKRLASASADGAVKIWDIKTQQAVLTFTAHKDEVTGVAFSRDGKFLLSSSRDKTAKLWNLDNGKEQFTVAGFPAPVLCAALSPDGQYGAAGSANTVAVIDVAKGEIISILEGHAGPVLNVAFSPDSRRLASVGADGVIKIWDLETKEEVLALEGHNGPVSAASFADKGRKLISSGQDATLRIWNAPKPGAQTYAQRRDAIRKSQGRWHFDAALEGEGLNNWHAAAFHYKRLIDIEPVKEMYHYHYGRALVQLGRRAEAKLHFAKSLTKPDVLPLPYQGHALAEMESWKQALEKYNQALKDPTAGIWVSSKKALLSLQLGDKAAYRDTCFELLKQHSETSDTAAANEIAWICAMSPHTVEDLSVAENLARTAINRMPNDTYQGTLGAVLYRSGKFEEAKKQLFKAIELNPNKGTPWEWIFLAMTEQKLANKAAAEQWYARTKAWMQNNTEVTGSGQPFSWERRLELPMLMSEAEALLKAAPQKKQQ